MRCNSIPQLFGLIPKLPGILYLKTKNPRTFGEVSRISQFKVAVSGLISSRFVKDLKRLASF